MCYITYNTLQYLLSRVEQRTMGKKKDLLVTGANIRSCTNSSSHCLTGNLPLYSSSMYFPTTLYLYLLHDLTYAHIPRRRRGKWGILTRKRKISHEASRDEKSVATTHPSPAVVSRGRSGPGIRHAPHRIGHHPGRGNSQEKSRSLIASQDQIFYNKGER